MTFDILREWVEEPNFRGCAFINATAEMASPDHELVKIARHHKNAGRRWFAEVAAAAGVRDPDGLAIQLAMLLDGAYVAADLYQDASAFAFARSAAETLLGAALAAGASAN